MNREPEKTNEWAESEQTNKQIISVRSADAGVCVCACGIRGCALPLYQKLCQTYAKKSNENAERK